MSLLDYQDPLSSWDDPNQFDLGKVFQPADLSNVAAPNDTLASNVGKGVESIGTKVVDFFTTTADLFNKGLGYVLQGKQAYDVITAPSNQIPQNPVANSQIPSLQGTQNTDAMYQNFLRLKQTLAQIITPKNSNQVAGTGPYTISPILIIAGIVFVLVLIARNNHVRG